MKSIGIFLILTAMTLAGWSQCEETAERCAQSFSDAYLVDPNFFQAQLGNDDVATFRAVWLKGNTYRIAVCTGDGHRAQWMVYDEQGTLLFENTAFENASAWDFLCEHTMHVQLIVKPDKASVQTTCVAVVHGFKK